MLSRLSWKVNSHRRIGQERFLQGFAGCDRRRAEGDESARSRKIRRHFEGDMTPETPADEAGLAEPERIHDRADGVGIARKRIGARILRVVRLAVAGQIDGEQPTPPPQPPQELPRENARRGRVAVDKHHGWTFARRLVNGDRAVRRIDPKRFHQPSDCASNSTLDDRARLRKLRPNVTLPEARTLKLGPKIAVPQRGQAVRGVSKA